MSRYVDHSNRSIDEKWVPRVLAILVGAFLVSLVLVVMQAFVDYNPKFCVQEDQPFVLQYDSSEGGSVYVTLQARPSYPNSTDVVDISRYESSRAGTEYLFVGTHWPRIALRGKIKYLGDILPENSDPADLCFELIQTGSCYDIKGDDIDYLTCNEGYGRFILGIFRLT